MIERKIKTMNDNNWNGKCILNLDGQFNGIMDNLIDHIQKAQEQALIHKIKVNSILIDKGIAVSNGFYDAGITGSNELSYVGQIPPMVLGLNVVYVNNLKDKGVNFALCYIERKEKNKMEEVKSEKLVIFDYLTNELRKEVEKDYPNKSQIKRLRIQLNDILKDIE